MYIYFQSGRLHFVKKSQNHCTLMSSPCQARGYSIPLATSSHYGPIPSPPSPHPSLSGQDTYQGQPLSICLCGCLPTKLFIATAFSRFVLLRGRYFYPNCIGPLLSHAWKTQSRWLFLLVITLGQPYHISAHQLHSWWPFKFGIVYSTNIL